MPKAWRRRLHVLVQHEDFLFLCVLRVLCGSRNDEGIPVCPLVEKVLKNTGISARFWV